MEEKLLNAADVAILLGTSEANIRAMRSRGQLPAAVKIGRRVRWRESEVRAWMAGLSDSRPPSRIAYVNPCPSTPGHVVMHNAKGERIDTFAGPRDTMIGMYAAAGWTVLDRA